jgi:hypothetical protein
MKLIALRGAELQIFFPYDPDVVAELRPWAKKAPKNSKYAMTENAH